MHFDTNGDGLLNKDELLQFAKAFAEHHGPPGGHEGMGPEGDRRVDLLVVLKKRPRRKRPRWTWPGWTGRR